MTTATVVDPGLLQHGAIADAKRHGHGLVTPAHLLGVLKSRYPQACAELLTDADTGAATRALARLPRSFEPPVLSPEVALLIGRSNAPVTLEALLPAVVEAVRRAATLPGEAEAEETTTPPGDAEADESDDDPLAGELTEDERAGAEQERPVHAINGEARQRRPLLVMAERFLEAALKDQATHALLRHVLGDASSGNRLARFADFFFTSSPVVAIESPIPYIEDVLCEVLLAHSAAHRGMAVTRTAPVSDDGGARVGLPYPLTDGTAVLVQLYGGVKLADPSRAGHELAVRDVSVLVGCHHHDNVPEPLRRIVDVWLQLPAMNESIFSAVYVTLFGDNLGEGWTATDRTWVPHVQHFDFEQPLRLGMKGVTALDYIRTMVLQRLRAVDVEDAKPLAQLHGLGDAHRFASDLVAEVRAATTGQLSWKDIDRGVLLAGPPGTGKTSLARAIARECGIRFIAASVTGWQAAGHLGDHIAAIRATFDEARRYAPAMLFLDEIDSLGNRSQLSGPGAQYQREVINCVLEQMQEFNPQLPVLVIGATNLPDSVDPALRRAGRLDRVIEIPYPNTEALAAIYADCLQRQNAAPSPAQAIDTALLGKMSLGLTGADVDLIVRGAARRARHAQRPLTTADVIAEITGKARDGKASTRLSDLEVARVAAHEAGHATAACLLMPKAEAITFVSIVPRSNGSLGFVATVPSTRALSTQRDYHNLLEVILAGRAAEELVYGAEGVSSGCANDLEVASSIALQMITQCGLGPDGHLRFVSMPTAEHHAEVEKLLSSRYQAVRDRLAENRSRLDRLASQLVAREELTADEVAEILQLG